MLPTGELSRLRKVVSLCKKIFSGMKSPILTHAVCFQIVFLILINHKWGAQPQILSESKGSWLHDLWHGGRNEMFCLWRGVIHEEILSAAGWVSVARLPRVLQHCHPSHCCLGVGAVCHTRRWLHSLISQRMRRRRSLTLNASQALPFF